MNFVSISHGRTGGIDALLAGYAAGALSPPLHALVASHLEMKADNRAFVRALEPLAADAIEPGASEPVADRGRRLAAIFKADAELAEPERRPSFLPAPIIRVIGARFDDLPWQGVTPGLKEVRLDHRPGCQASMLWIEAGSAMPAPLQAELEVTLVLKGSFEDASGRYERGDIAIADCGLDHGPLAGTDEDCVCFAVLEGAARPIERLFDIIGRR